MFSFMFSFNIKLYTPEDDIVDAETCRVNNQPNCTVVVGV
jgi:hypothetical protein